MGKLTKSIRLRSLKSTRLKSPKSAGVRRFKPSNLGLHCHCAESKQYFLQLLQMAKEETVSSDGFGRGIIGRRLRRFDWFRRSAVPILRLRARMRRELESSYLDESR